MSQTSSYRSIVSNLNANDHTSPAQSVQITRTSSNEIRIPMPLSFTLVPNSLSRQPIFFDSPQMPSLAGKNDSKKITAYDLEQPEIQITTTGLQNP